jgi:hypothetical protein
MFSLSKLSQVPVLSSSHASLLSWSVSPRLARPDVMNNTRVAQLTADINAVLSRPDFNKIRDRFDESQFRTKSFSE